MNNSTSQLIRSRLCTYLFAISVAIICLPASSQANSDNQPSELKSKAAMATPTAQQPSQARQYHPNQRHKPKYEIAQFNANKRCALFRSKNKKSNPDKLYTEAGQTYSVIESTVKGNQLKWHRVKIENSRQPRWVNANCGSIDNYRFRAIKPHKPQTAMAESSGQACSLEPKQQDSHILALTWQNTFCSYNSKKPACQLGQQHKQFTLHGLWPNSTLCGQNYNYCGEIKQRPNSLCQYPALSLSVNTRQKLERVMPSSKAGGCLQRHEYWKHGTCSGLDAENYIELSSHLAKQMNRSRFVKSFINSQIGQRVDKKHFMRVFEQSFGKGSSRRLSLYCKQDNLLEIRLSLPANISATAPLATLLKQGKPTRDTGRCGQQFKLP